MPNKLDSSRPTIGKNKRFSNGNIKRFADVIVIFQKYENLSVTINYVLNNIFLL